MALTLAGTVAYVSIKGLLLVFSGVGLLGLIFFTTIEVSKIIATSTLHTYGDKLNIWYKVMLTTCVGIAMVITSIGVYGFLTSNYKETSNKLKLSNSEVMLIEGKKSLLEANVLKIQNQIDFKTNQVTKLTELRVQQENRLDSLYNRNQIRNARVVQGIISETNTDLKIVESDINNLYLDLSKINDSIINLDITILEMNSNNDLSSELGPLMYLAEITNSDMDSVIKWFILLLIIIGDPMAVLLIIVFTKIANSSNDNNVTKLEEKKPKPNSNYGNLFSPQQRFTNYTPKVFNSSEEGLVNKNTEPTENESNKVEVIEKAVEILQDLKETNKEETLDNSKESRRPVTINDIAEKKNRGFSVEIPNPSKKEKNTINRIGSNKEVRSDEAGKIFFKRK